MGAALTPVSRLGVCSWSLRPSGPGDLAARVAGCGLRAVQIHLAPIRTGAWRCDETAGLLREHRIKIVSGMMSMKGEDYSTLDSIRATGGIRPDSTWDENLRAAEGNAIFAQRLGLSLVTFHAGFIPHEDGPERERLVDRLSKLAEVFAARGVMIALETGQETAETLLGVLEALDQRTGPSFRVGVNFDPANMILYGMGDPVVAVGVLGPRIVQVHIKDANPSDSLGEWGSEVPVGRGSVRWREFFSSLGGAGFCGNLCIEREAGDTREADIVLAREFLASIN